MLLKVKLKMSGFEAGQVTYTYQGQATETENDDSNKMSKDDALIRFIRFIREWTVEEKYFYR